MDSLVRKAFTFLPRHLGKPVRRTGLIILAVLVFDGLTPQGIAAPMLYMAAVLSAVPIPHERAVVSTALVCSVLVLLGWLISPGPADLEWWKFVLNRGLALGIIWTTASMASAWLGVQQAQAKQMQVNRLLHQAMSLSMVTDSFEAALRSCVNIVCEITTWPVGHVYTYDERSRRLASTDIWAVPDGSDEAAIQQLTGRAAFRRGEGVPGRIWEAGEPIWLSAIDDPRFEDRENSPLTVKAAFGFPVIVDGETVAVIEFFTPNPITPDPELLLLVGSVGNQLGRLTERRRRIDEQSRIAAIVDSSYDAIISKDLNGRIISWNRGAEQTYGYTEEEAVGESIAIILPKDLDEEEPTIIDALQQGERLTQFETVRRRKDGAEINVALTVSPIRDARGRVVGLSTIERDISTRKRREEELQEAKREAEAASEAKSEFLANISHELRTPMNAVLGMLDLVLGDELDDAMRDYLETARDSGQTLLHLLNDLLDVSRMEAGQFELDHEPFDLHEILDGVTRTLGVRASEKGLELACHIGRDVPQKLVGDGFRLRQVMLNLAGNAIKFTEQGEVVVRAVVASQDDQRVELLFTVQDTGIGISREDQERIFAPFTQVDASSTRERTGTGLGLSICRQLIDKMEGDIRVKSVLGEGTTFYCTVWFDLAPGDESAAPDTRELVDLPVLIVDDNPTNLRILEETLSGWSMRPMLAETGQEALQIVDRFWANGQPFPLIIVDALMPELDGFAFIDALQSRDDIWQETAAVLMVSSADRQTFRERSAGLEVAAYLEKPVTQSALLDAVMTALKGPPLEQAAVEQVQTTSRSLRVLVVEDTSANQKVVKTILERRGHQVQLADNGREGVDLVNQGGFDVVLMDMQMPTMDGLQATQAIRSLAREEKRTVPIIAMTAHARREDRRRCLDFGMDAYLSKPLDAAKLVRLVETVRHRPRDQGLEDSTPTTHKSTTVVGAKRVINLSAAMMRMGDDESLVADMARFFQDDAPKLVTEIEDALQ
ncbi:MAG: response regulator, partial [Planctomycetaceae bacterium]